MIMLSCYHDNMLSYFFPENFTHCIQNHCCGTGTAVAWYSTATNSTGTVVVQWLSSGRQFDSTSEKTQFPDKNNVLC
jgi:hypothetical protein